MSLTLAQTVKSAARVGTPIIIARTSDPTATIARISEVINTATGGLPQNVIMRKTMIQWDVVRGAVAVDEESNTELTAALQKAGIDQPKTTSAKPFLLFIRNLPNNSFIFMLNIHRFASDDINVIQAIWNLRDEFKSRSKVVIGLCPQMTLPAELAQDVLVLDEPLPTDEELKAIAKEIFTSAQLPQPKESDLNKIVDAVLGLAAFPAEQSMAMSITTKGMDIPKLWNRKQSTIEQTPGLSVWRGAEKFSDIGGCDNVKSFLKDVIGGADAPRAIVFIDEIEKAIGTGQDTSGVSQGLLGALLTWMQDNAATGCIFIGPPGAAKSAMAKATGNEAGIPTISLDMGAMKNSLVGASEERFRNALKVIDAVSQKRTLFIATCNSIGILPPELRRRFTFGTFYFSVPTDAERAAIWKIYRGKYKVDTADAGVKHDHGWTGAEIKQCCELSYRLRRPLNDCASFIVPVSISAADQIEKLNQQADGKFISASKKGIYKFTREDQEHTAGAANRSIVFEEN